MRTLLSLLTAVVLLLTLSHSPAFAQARDLAPPTQDPGWELGHTRPVSDLAYSWDGKIIASTGEDGSVRLWNAADGALGKTLLGDAKQGLAVRFAPDGRSLASCGRDKLVRVWSLPEGGLIHTLSGHTTLVRALAWSPAGTLLASGGEDGQVFLWNLASGDHQVLHTPMPVVDTLVFSPDGKTLTVDSEKESNLPNENAPRGRRYGEKGTHLIALYDVETGQPRQNWLTQSGLSEMTFSPDSSLIAIYAPNPKSTLGETTIRDAYTGRVLETLLSATTNRPPHIVFSSDQKTFLALDAQATVGGELGQVWNLTQPTPKAAKFAVNFNVRTLSPDGSSLAGQDYLHYNRVVVYDSLTWRERWASADPSLILGSKPTLALLNQLGEDYRAYGMPMLPKSAYLAYLKSVSHKFVGAGPAYPRQSERTLAFVVPPDHSDSQTSYLYYGRRDIANPKVTVRAVSPDQVPLQPTADPSEEWDAFSTDLVTAIHMQERGWTALALEYLKRALADYRGDARHQLAEEAWQHWEPTLWEPKTDRHAALTAMQRLVQSGFLKEEAPQRMPYSDVEEALQRSLVADLEATLAPSIAAPGSIEAEMDALVDYHDGSIYLLYERPGARPLWSETDPRFKKLWLRGFEAVPILLKHLNDQRFTRTYSRFSRFSPSYSYRISHVVADLLIGLAGSEEAVGAHTTSRNSGKIIDPVLIQGATCGDAKQEVKAFQKLAAMKRPETLRLLIHRLDHLPATPPGVYENCEAAGLAAVVQTVDAPRGWLALERLARRSDVGQRLEILNSIIDCSTDAQRKRHQVTFLAKFVQDQTLRVVPPEKFVEGWPTRGKYDGIFADEDMARITVQDAALRDLSYLIGSREYPAVNWTKAQWNTWRNTMLRTLHTYLAQAK